MAAFISKNIRHWVLRRPPQQFAAAFNACNRFFWRMPLTVRHAPQPNCMIADDGHSQIHFCRTERVFRYASGIEPFLDKLAREYMIHDIEFNDGDWFVDCGANVGEVSLWIKRTHPHVKIVAVEPEAREANCTDMNIFDGSARTLRQALWKQEEMISFYSKPESADSSLFETEDPAEITKIQARTLSSLAQHLGINRLRLLKLEAEGAEPEVIEGCGEFLRRIDYIAADCGPERGLEKKETATDLINLLLANGFELERMSFDRVVCRFRNRLATV